MNSFHSSALNEKSKPDELEVIATCIRDHTIEAYKGEKIVGMMWHPEREEIFSEWEAKIIKKLFNYD